MDKMSSPEDELYYTSQNFQKLKHSNTAFINNTEKEKEENKREIDALKFEYEKLRKDIISLKHKVSL